MTSDVTDKCETCGWFGGTHSPTCAPAAKDVFTTPFQDTGAPLHDLVHRKEPGVRRYHSKNVPQMYEAENGGWVSFADHDTLLAARDARIAQLTAENAAMRELLASIAADPPNNWWYGERCKEKIDALLASKAGPEKSR